MEIVYLPKADEDLEYWIKTGNKAVLKKIAQLTEAIINNPYSGIGKPEALKYQLSVKWSRRITDETNLGIGFCILKPKNKLHLELSVCITRYNITGLRPFDLLLLLFRSTKISRLRPCIGPLSIVILIVTTGRLAL